MSRITTSVVAIGVADPELVPVEVDPTPAKKPSKPDAAATPVAEIEETP
jgi:hypothetical protein